MKTEHVLLAVVGVGAVYLLMNRRPGGFQGQPYQQPKPPPMLQPNPPAPSGGGGFDLGGALNGFSNLLDSGNNIFDSFNS